MPVTYDDLVTTALELPDTEEALMYGNPAIKRAGRFMFAPKKDGETIAVKLDWDTHDSLLEKRPDVFYKTPDYEGWPGFPVRLDKLDKSLAKEVVHASWEDAHKPAKRRKAK